MPEKKPRIERLSPAPGQRILVVSDVHGNLPYLRGALDRAHFGGDDLLIFDGDFLEKGEQSLDTLHAVMELCAAGRAMAVCGNCDEWAEIFSMDRDTDARIREYLLWRGCGLIWDMCARIGRSIEEPDFTALKSALREPFAAEWDFLARIPHAIETEHYIFAHAGAHAGKPLEEHRVQELVKYDNFLRSDESFDKWIVVGHWPVVLYGESVVNANPIVDRQRKIISIDGGCVLKDDGQLNVLIIPEEGSEDFSFVSYDPFPTARVTEDQQSGGRSYYIRWGDSRVRVLRRGEEFSLCRHERTGYEMEILTKYLFTDGEVTDCNDCTDYVLPLRRGDTVSIVERTSRGYFVKHNGVSGWYFGALEED